MKNKISFTSVLKSKQNRHISSTQYSTQSQQNRHQKLIDIYQQFQSYPEQDYTLDFNAFRNVAHRSRNTSMNMARSKNVNQDPQLNLESWIEKQKQQNYQSFTKGPNTKKSFKETLTAQQEIAPIGRRSKSNLNRNQIYPEQDDCEEQTNYYQPNGEKNNAYQQDYIEETNTHSQKSVRKSPISYRAQSNPINESKSSKAKQQMEESSKMNSHQSLASEQLKSKSHYPDLEEQDYERLKEQFEKMKNEKITELCMQTKKSFKKEKLQQIISKALQNIYEDIQDMAEQMKIQRKNSNLDANKKLSQQEVSEQMLISGSHQGYEDNALTQSEEEIERVEEEKRKEQMKNMIKGYISGIQEAKSQGKSSTNYQEAQSVQNDSFNYQQGKYQSRNSRKQESQEHSFNHNNTFNNEINYENTFNNEIHNEQIQPHNSQSNTKCSVPLDSVGYSFSNNIICEHSFSRELTNNNHFQHHDNDNEINFYKNNVQPPIYEPENSDNEEQQRISLPNIEEVKSDCGDFGNDQMEVESSEEIEFTRNKMQNLTLDITGNNIKNIESVHYQPPSSQPQMSGYFQFNAQNNPNSLFKNFEHQKDEIGKEENIHQEQRFVSKTFNSYLNGEMRAEYGQASRENVVGVGSVQSSTKQSGLGYKISPINKYSPKNNEAKQVHQLESSNINSEQKCPIQQISSPQQQNNSTRSFVAQDYQNVSQFGKTNMNESQNLSLNQSFNQQSVNLGLIVSPKNIHQLQSKNKFSINSPMMKIDQIISQEERKSQHMQVNEFCSNGAKLDGSKSYAISSPVGDYKISQSFQKKVLQHSSGIRNDNKYACAQSIVSNPQIQSSFQVNNKTSSNSILAMQPLKLSSVNESIGKQSTKSNKITEEAPAYTKQRVAESIQNNEIYVDNIQNQRQSVYSHSQSPNISNGRNFLQSLHEKQSIQIDLPSSGEKESEKNLLVKQSFVAETFRPLQHQQNNIKESVKTASLIEGSQPNSSNKISITKITLRSSDRNSSTSPKVLSLTVNNMQQKNEPIKQFTLNPYVDGKQNIFQKLIIKESKNFESGAFENKLSMSNHMQHSVSNNMQQSIKNSQNFGASKPQNHTDFSSKQNSNTLNNSINTNDWKNQNIKLDTKQHYESEKESTLMSSKPSVVQRKEPLLKLSKNLGNSIKPHENVMNVKKSIGQSIRNKVHLPSSMIVSKTISIGGRQSFKGGVKQSIGNDSDMDFDLELD